MNTLNLLLVTLAAFYSAFAITSTKGPFHCFAWLREHAPLGGLTTCFVCASFWCGLVFYLLSLIAPQALIPFGGAGAAVLLWRYTGGDRV